MKWAPTKAQNKSKLRWLAVLLMPPMCSHQTTKLVQWMKCQSQIRDVNNLLTKRWLIRITNSFHIWTIRRQTKLARLAQIAPIPWTNLKSKRRCKKIRSLPLKSSRESSWPWLLWVPSCWSLTILSKTPNQSRSSSWVMLIIASPSSSHLRPSSKSLLWASSWAITPWRKRRSMPISKTHGTCLMCS